jgi:magnesium chelatase family protein
VRFDWLPHMLAERLGIGVLWLRHLSVYGANGKKATRPCPCGSLSHYSGKCHCTPDQVARYRRKIYGPLLDRIDLHVEVPAVPRDEMAARPVGDASETIRARVVGARERQLARQGKPNALLSTREIDKYAAPDPVGEQILKQAISRLALSARGYHRVLKVARTIADLAGVETITAAQVAEAVQYRRLERT